VYIFNNVPLILNSVGLWAIAGVRTIVPAFYSLKDAWTPLKIALICLGANVILNGILIIPLKHAGLALATSLSSILNLLLLTRKLSPKLGGIKIRENVISLTRIFLCSLPMGLIAYGICSFGDWSTTGGEIQKMTLLGLGIVIGISIYLAISYGVKNEEMLFLLKIVKRKKKRISNPQIPISQ